MPRARRVPTAATILGIGLLASGCFGAPTAPKPVDPTVAPETRNLLASIHRLGWSDQIALGQEMPLTFSRKTDFKADLDRSDLHDVVGDHPGVHGCDFHYIIDKPDQRAGHIAGARKAYADGAIVAFNHHWLGRHSKTFRPHPEDDQTLARVVRGDDSQGDVAWFYQTLDTILAILNDELRFPIVFRPLHEMNGDWFWWGSQMEGGAETYRRAFQLIVEYMSQRTEYALFCWSPDKALALDFYPGDEYVDIVGMDAYTIGLAEHVTIDRAVSLLEELVDFAKERGKVAAFTETGATTDQKFDYTERAPRWWTENLLAAIHATEKTRQIAWVQTWINSPWSGPYVPHADASEASKQDIKAFCDAPGILLQEDVAKLNVYGARAREAGEAED